MDIPEPAKKEIVDLLDEGRFEARILEDGGLWDGFVDASPCSTLFHKWDFLRIMEKHTGYKLFPYGIFMDGRLRCVFPLYFRRDLGIKAAYSAPPKANLPYLGFLTDLSYDALGQAENEPLIYGISGKIDECVSALSPNYTYVQTVPEVLDVRPLQRYGYRTEIGFDYYMDLTPPIDEIWDNLSKKCKHNIKHQEDMGLEIKISDDVDTFYDRMRDRFTSLGLSTYYHKDHRAYLKEAVNAFPDNLKMSYVCHQGQAEGAVIYYSYNGRYLLWLGIGGGKYNDYFMWELIKSAKASGMIQLKNPGADTKRLTPFKSKFNPSLEIVYSFYKTDRLGTLVNNSFSMMKRMRNMKGTMFSNAAPGES